MATVVYNYPSAKRGDNLPVRNIKIEQVLEGVKTPVDLTNVDIKVFFTLPGEDLITKDKTDGISSDDYSLGDFNIDSFQLDVAGKWEYEVQLTFDTVTVKTWLQGAARIYQDISD